MHTKVSGHSLGFVVYSFSLFYGSDAVLVLGVWQSRTIFFCRSVMFCCSLFIYFWMNACLSLFVFTKLFFPSFVLSSFIVALD
jgi:hypothetical protein